MIGFTCCWRAQLVVPGLFAPLAPVDIRPAQSNLTLIGNNPGLTQTAGQPRHSASSARISSACSTNWRGAGSPSAAGRARQALLRLYLTPDEGADAQAQAVLAAHEASSTASARKAATADRAPARHRGRMATRGATARLQAGAKASRSHLGGSARTLIRTDRPDRGRSRPGSRSLRPRACAI